MASRRPAQPIACDGSRRRRHGGERDRSHGQRSKPVPVWARIRGLARHDAAPELPPGKERLERTSKRGDRYICSLLVAGSAPCACADAERTEDLAFGVERPPKAHGR